MSMTASKTTSENREDIARLTAESNRVSAELLISDADLGMTFLHLAESSHSREDKFRRLHEAHTAYITILEKMERLNLDAEQAKLLQGKIQALNEALIAAGVQLD